MKEGYKRPKHVIGRARNYRKPCHVAYKKMRNATQQLMSW
jgi:hypothetical protein